MTLRQLQNARHARSQAPSLVRPPEKDTGTAASTERLRRHLPQPKVCNSPWKALTGLQCSQAKSNAYETSPSRSERREAYEPVLQQQSQHARTLCRRPVGLGRPRGTCHALMHRVWEVVAIRDLRYAMCVRTGTQLSEVCLQSGKRAGLGVGRRRLYACRVGLSVQTPWNSCGNGWPLPSSRQDTGPCMRFRVWTIASRPDSAHSPCGHRGSMIGNRTRL